MTLEDIQNRVIISQASTLVDDPCWLWQGKLDGDGYGRITVGKRTTGVHRWAFTMANGWEPHGLDVHHWCDVRKCCCPSHLDAMPHDEHMKITACGEYNALKTHCDRGHEFSADNTDIVTPNGANPYRRCVTCYRAAKANYKYRQGPARLRAAYLASYHRRKHDPRYIAARKRRQKRWEAKNPEKVREINRVKIARFRARKKAALSESTTARI